MPSILNQDDNVTYIARKNFVYLGKQYNKGDDIPEINDHYRLEVWVRNGYVIPVVEDKDKLPFQFRRTVMTRDMAFAKLRIGNPTGGDTKPGLKKDAKLVGEDPNAPDLTEPEIKAYPHDYTVAEVVEYAQNHVDELENLIDAEERGKERSTLLEKLYDLLDTRLVTDPEPEDVQPEADDAQPEAEQSESDIEI